MTARPHVRLKPKVNPRPLRFGAPWVFADGLVMDRRTRAIPAGSIVVVEDANRAALGLGAFNASSKIAVRILDRDSDAQIDADWLRAKLQAALEMREQLYPEPFYRLVHAEGDGLPGLIVDRFGDTLAVQPNAAWADQRFEMITEVLQATTGADTIVKNASGRARTLEGLDDVSIVHTGAIDGPVPVPMNGATYMADLLGGQKTGLFFDQRDNHALAAKMARGGRVLDVFSHVGGFALAALAAGATEALSVDGSAPALALAEEGAQRTGVAPQFATRQGDAFDTMAALSAEGERFDTVICDPPAFAPAKAALEAGLRAYERIARLGAGLVSSGGYLVLCSCSHAADLPKFRSASLTGVGKAGRQAQVLATGSAGPDHPAHPYLAETSYLKAIFLRLN